MSTASILRPYKPSECGDDGYPLDWERCRPCDGSGELRQMGTAHDGGEYRPCERCGGHGSLKAAALDRAAYRAAAKELSPYVQTMQDWRAKNEAPRCESCAHPMSEGTWEGEQRGSDLTEQFTMACHALSGGREPTNPGVHYSPCDEKCDHGDPGRRWIDQDPPTLYAAKPEPRVESSWRPVDIRVLGFPNDLSPDNLAVLCLRCLAERAPQTRTFTMTVPILGARP